MYIENTCFMRKNRKKYMVTAENSEAFACSLVSDPAVEELFVAFSKDKEIIEKLSDNKKHLITGVVAVPNKPIYRNNGEEEYDIVFSSEAIESLSKKFMKNYRQKSVTLQHQEDAEGIYMVEQWLKADGEHDKSVALGFSSELPEGTWFQTYYVDSNEVWNRITSGELRGFSLECVLGVEEFEKQIFEEQTPTVTETVEAPVVETPVVEETPTIEETPVVEEPKSSIEDRLDMIWEVVQTMLPKEPKVEEVKEELEPVQEEKPIEEVKPQEEAKPNPLDEVVKNLQSEIETLKANNSSLLEQIKAMGTEPSVKPVNTNATGSSEGDTFRNWRDQMGELYR